MYRLAASCLDPAFFAIVTRSSLAANSIRFPYRTHAPVHRFAPTSRLRPRSTDGIPHDASVVSLTSQPRSP